jgi:hypothetical protein
MLFVSSKRLVTQSLAAASGRILGEAEFALCLTHTIETDKGEDSTSDLLAARQVIASPSSETRSIRQELGGIGRLAHVLATTTGGRLIAKALGPALLIPLAADAKRRRLAGKTSGPRPKLSEPPWARGRRRGMGIDPACYRVNAATRLLF